MSCIFCDRDKIEVFAENDYVVAVKDISPVTEGHTLIIPKEHRLDFFELSIDEKKASFDLMEQLKEKFEKEDPNISGFNIGMNCGKDAGQTVFHCHIHLIPRRKGDCEAPAGGVRGVIPGKQSY